MVSVNAHDGQAVAQAALAMQDWSTAQPATLMGDIQDVNYVTYDSMCSTQVHNMHVNIYVMQDMVNSVLSAG